MDSPESIGNTVSNGREVDLGRWLDETNAIPADPETAAEQENAEGEER